MLGSSYPLLNTFWTILYFFLFFLWLMILFRVIWDIFRSHDLSGVGKAGWLLFILILPFLGVFVYVIVRGRLDAREGRKSRPGTGPGFTELGPAIRWRRERR